MDEAKRHGASLEEWSHWSFLLGLTQDLLPVVSNPHAVISPGSGMTGLGKTPSRYNNARHASGILRWTQFTASADNVAQWSREPDYGICLQARTVRALDVDVTDAVLAARIHAEIDRFLRLELPCRHRSDSSRFLLAFTLPGEYRKRTIKTGNGVLEFLAGGNQFIVAGTHQSGARYTWGDSIRNGIPTLTPEQFEALWSHLAATFAVETPTETRNTPSRAFKLSEALKNDPIAAALHVKGFVLSAGRDHSLHILCPFAGEHGANTGDSSTSYFPAHTGGFERGHFICLHAHCAGRTDSEFLAALGFDGSEDFDVMADIPPVISGADIPAQRYAFESLPDAISRPLPEFIIKNLLPRAELAIIYGASRSGKSFFALDLAFAVARGVPWRSLKVRQSGVAYVAAEGAAGFRSRLKAYTTHHGLDPAPIPFSVLDAAPSLLRAQDMSDLMHAVGTLGSVGLIFLDTLARVTVGGDENSAQDMGRALAACQHLHRATGALVVLIHHSGKDSSRGARGSTALIGAADAELEITDAGNGAREARVTKMKDGADGGRYGFKLVPVKVGEDEDGADVVSCVIEYAEARAAARYPAARANVQAQDEEALLQAHAGLTGLSGDGVVNNTLIEEAVGLVPFDVGARKSDPRRGRLLRELARLTDRGIFIQADGRVFRPEAAE